jgi:small subunit ribosomal protein S14
MARKALVEREKRRQKMVDNSAEKRAGLKKIIKSFDSSIEEKEKAMDDLNKMKKDSSKVRLHNRCKLTGRPKGYLRKFGMSRLCFRELALEGFIPGVTKSSW